MIHKVGAENDEWCAQSIFALGQRGQVVLCAKSVKRDLIQEEKRPNAKTYL